MSYNTELQANNADLQAILAKVNALPEAGGTAEPVLQEKSVTPTKSVQVIEPDSGYDGLSRVNMGAIPEEYIIPSGTKSITANGTHDVTANAAVSVNVPVPDGYIVPSGTKTITANGTHDVRDYASVAVNVAAGTSNNVAFGTFVLEKTISGENITLCSVSGLGFKPAHVAIYGIAGFLPVGQATSCTPSTLSILGMTYDDESGFWVTCAKRGSAQLTSSSGYTMCSILDAYTNVTCDISDDGFVIGIGTSTSYTLTMPGGTWGYVARA